MKPPGREGYTRRSVTSLVRPLAVSLLLVIGGLSPVALACEWMCAPAAHDAGQHTTHHSHMAGPDGTGSSAPVRVGSTDGTCQHQGIATAIGTSTFRLWAPVTAQGAAGTFVASLRVAIGPVTDALHGPPGSPPLLSLRI